MMLLFAQEKAAAAEETEQRSKSAACITTLLAGGGELIILWKLLFISGQGMQMQTGILMLGEGFFFLLDVLWASSMRQVI